MERRDFLKSLAGATAGLVLPSVSFSTEQDRIGDLLPRRFLGQTGQTVTMLGVGGWHIGHMDTGREVQATIETALEGGVRFFDSAESYQRGESERRLGQFLTPKYRDVVYLMTKTTAKDAKTAQNHLDGSLKRLKTDYLDLWQMHTVKDPKDVDLRMEQGVLEVMTKAKGSGKVRHIGFTGHKRPSAHQRILENTEAFEACQMPINLMDPAYNSFIDGILPTLVERKIGVLAMKTLANGRFFSGSGTGTSLKGQPPLVPDRVSITEALHFVWALPVSVLITGPDDSKQMAEKIAIARSFTGMALEQRQALIERISDLSGKAVEYYKA